MSKSSSAKRITAVRASSVAMYEGTFAAILGLGVAVLFSLNATIELASSTNSVLAGLAFGLASGIVSIIVLPFVYFAFGYVVGYLHGWVFNVVAANSGGIVVDVEEA